MSSISSIPFQISVSNRNRNIAVTDINPQYVWGGDGITLNDCDLVWIDHVTVGPLHFLLYQDKEAKKSTDRAHWSPAHRPRNQGRQPRHHFQLLHQR